MCCVYSNFNYAWHSLEVQNANVINRKFRCVEVQQHSTKSGSQVKANAETKEARLEQPLRHAPPDVNMGASLMNILKIEVFAT